MLYSVLETNLNQAQSNLTRYVMASLRITITVLMTVNQMAILIDGDLNKDDSDSDEFVVCTIHILRNMGPFLQSLLLPTWNYISTS